MNNKNHNVINPEKVVFIDRDGVINRDSPNYIKNCDEFYFLPGSIEAFRILKINGFSAIVITNQSVIGRKLTSSEELEKIFNKMTDTIKSTGGHITDILFCPHLPSDACNCRKPAPGMILEAKKRYSIDLSTAVMIGDSAKDIECARNAGVGSSILVRTGNGEKAIQSLSEKKITPDHIADDLLCAVNFIVSSRRSHD